MIGARGCIVELRGGRLLWFFGSIRKPNGVSKMSATSSGLGVSVKPGRTKPTTGVIR